MQVCILGPLRLYFDSSTRRVRSGRLQLGQSRGRNDATSIATHLNFTLGRRHFEMGHSSPRKEEVRGTLYIPS